MDSDTREKINVKKMVSKNGNKYTRVLIFDFDDYVYQTPDGKKFIKLLIFNDDVRSRDFLLSKPRENFEEEKGSSIDDFDF